MQTQCEWLGGWMRLHRCGLNVGKCLLYLFGRELRPEDQVTVLQIVSAYPPYRAPAACSAAPARPRRPRVLLQESTNCFFF
eukprot:SAG31_NODE_21889_length_538_cov_1.248292_1_plen_80_part_10